MKTKRKPKQNARQQERNRAADTLERAVFNGELGCVVWDKCKRLVERIRKGTG